MIAASAVHCTLRIRESRWIWSEYLHREVTCGKYSEEALRECSYAIIKRFVGLTFRRDKKYQRRLRVVEGKFSHSRYCKAALVRPKADSDKDK